MKDQENDQENDEVKTSGVVILKKPLILDGEEKTEIHYDFEDVRPIQYMNLLKRLKKHKVITVPELDEDVQLGYFSLASGIPVSDLNRIDSVSDLTTMLALVRNFLL